MVFVTAYDQYAIQAFETGAVDYILKPATDERLAVTIERLKAKLATPPTDLDAVLAKLTEQLGGGKRERLQWIKATHRPEPAPHPGGRGALLPVRREVHARGDRRQRGAHQDADPRAHRRPRPRGLLADPPLDARQRRTPSPRVTRDFRGQAHVKIKGKDESLVVSRIYSHLFKQM